MSTVKFRDLEISGFIKFLDQMRSGGNHKISKSQNPRLNDFKRAGAIQNATNKADLALSAILLKKKGGSPTIAEICAPGHERKKFLPGRMKQKHLQNNIE